MTPGLNQDLNVRLSYSLSASLTATVPDSCHLNITVFVSQLTEEQRVELFSFYQKCFSDDGMTSQTNLHRPGTQLAEDLNTGVEILISDR